MSNFKVEDRVRTLVDFLSAGFKAGSEGEVISISESKYDEYPIKVSFEEDEVYGFKENELKLISSSNDQTVPAEIVRNTIQKYTKMYDWKDSDVALQEMNLLEDEMVQVTYTQTAVYTLNKNDLDSLLTQEQCDDLDKEFLYFDKVRRQYFKKNSPLIPHADFSIKTIVSDPILVKE